MEKEEWVYKYTILLFAYFKARYANNPYRDYEPAPNEQKMIQNFSKALKKQGVLYSVGQEYLIRYFMFQFCRWYNIDSVQFGKNKVQIGWIIGTKALSFWINRDQEYDWIVEQNKFVKACRIEKAEIYAIFKEEFISDNTNVELNISEEIDKKRFHNDFYGFANCIETTTLFNKFSSLCMKCNVRDDCKKLLNVKYPKLYKARGYGEGKVK